jgi:DNA-3-methyladenine glycosylase I
MTSGLVPGPDGKPRCFWSHSAPEYVRYHDQEWGFPVTDDRLLFEKICLEGFQAGLSWLTILRKREAFREAFDGFDFHKVARYSPSRVQRLLANASIVRHRGKIEATINNARRACEIEQETGSLSAWLWQFEPSARDRPKRITHEELMQMSTTPASIALSKELKRRGWAFVGPTTVYAFMQAMGLVNDHLEGCSIRKQVEKVRKIRPGAA